MSDENPSPAELADFLRSFSRDQFPDDGRMMCAAADAIDDALALLDDVLALLRELADSGLWLGGDEAGWTARIAALLEGKGR